MVDSELTRFMVADLLKSGLAKERVKKLGVYPMSAAQLEGLAERPIGAGYAIPYPDFEGKKTQFARYKLLDRVVFRGSSMRYWQPPNTPPRLYVPPLIAWKDVLKNKDLEVWITEGEKKAASLCALGVPCVAVSGVWAWTSKKFQQSLIPELRVLMPRSMVLCFDSDAEENPSIKGALTALAIQIERLGGSVRLCQLPQVKKQEKTGLDDFIVHYKKSALKELAALDKEPLGLSAALHALNLELMYVEEQQQFFHTKTQKFSHALLLINTIMADRMITVYDRAGQAKQINAAAEWVKWPQRRLAPRIEYQPGKPQSLEDGSYNLWKGWGVEPKEGDTKPFDELFAYLSSELTLEQRTWWLQWMAYPLQHPGVKLFSACLIYSHHHGTGKSVLGYTLGRIYGENYVEVTQENLHSAFNDWARCRQFILGDEITGSDRRSDADKLKHLITRPKILVNQKFQPVYEIADTCNYLLTTNQPDAIFIEKTDRRNFIVEISGEPLSKAFYAVYDRFYKSDKGAAAVFHKLLNVNLAGFDPHAAAPQTEAKEAMRVISGSEADGMIRDFLTNPGAVLKIGSVPVGRELLTLKEIQDLLDPTGRLGRMQIARALRRLNTPPPFLVRARDGMKYLYAVKNFDHWIKADHATRAAHYDGELMKKENQRKNQRAKIQGKSATR